LKERKAYMPKNEELRAESSSMKDDLYQKKKKAVE